MATSWFTTLALINTRAAWFNWIPGWVSYIYPSCVGRNYLSISKLQRFHGWSLKIYKQFHDTLYWVYDYLSMLGFLLVKGALFIGKISSAYTEHSLNKHTVHAFLSLLWLGIGLFTHIIQGCSTGTGLIFRMANASKLILMNFLKCIQNKPNELPTKAICALHLCGSNIIMVIWLDIIWINGIED